MSVAYARELHANTSGETHLGPARVVDMRGTTPMVELPDGRAVRAEMALAFPYAPKVDDVLLVIGQHGRTYVIGVLQGQSAVALRFMGDVRLHAIDGKLDLSGDKGVRIHGDAVELCTRTLKVVADSVVQKAVNVYQRVRETLDVHAGEKRELVDGALSVRAETASTTTRGIVTINGKQVHLC